jgi:uncharacterized phage protein (TIGR02216 family)
MSVLDWPRLMQAAARMGLSPDAFWKTSLKEWRLLVAAQNNGAMARSELEALAVLHPDRDPK